MSYATVFEIRQDAWIRNRVSACVAVEGLPGRPEEWMTENAWELAAQPGWADAWEYARTIHAEDPEYLPGKDELVITDAMILSAVQLIHSESTE